ncbi:xanthine dehydrogenase family protein molybdopterin-binding subunit [Rugosimonospora africana]|uniref:Aldehyde dehydrogenase n=1 Tax=Rugosimonospora africana TaxID=556532 RepID=A0A8J3VRK9_9ACTN|nr:molybdopterin cofactor-binding domain-containing protein [Rugosimonospora africana]GIH16315.1 aldehyde dehydrogenase [Rugosimonospora africana]
MTAGALSRRGFLKGAGSLAVGFALAPALGLHDVAAAAPSRDRELRVDPATHAGADDSWLILAPGKTTIYSARVELGTGVQTALTQIVLEELRLGTHGVDFVQGDTIHTPSASTTGSKSIQTGGPLLRQAAATAYQALLGLAAEDLRVAPSRLAARDGVFTVIGTPRRVTYDHLLSKAHILLTADDAAPVVAPADYRIVGQPVARADLPAKAHATFAFVSDVVVPHMLHGKVIRPTGRNSTFSSITPDSLARARAIPGFVQLVQKGNFVGVVATSEYAASVAAAPATGVVVQWEPGPPLAPQETLDAELRKPENHYLDYTDQNVGDFGTAFAAAERQITARYFSPFQMHAAMGASCAVADVRAVPDPITGIQATIWSGSQNVYGLRGVLAALLFGSADDVQRVYVRYEEGSGCYGHNGADDAAADAALLSQAVGKPVRVQWTRQDENGWEPLGEAASHDLEAGITGGQVVAWHHRLYALTANSRPSGNNPGTVLAGTLTGFLPADLPDNSHDSSGRNAPVTYDFANCLTDAKLVRSFNTDPANPRRATAPLTYRFLRTTALRSLGGFSNSFANESFLDELAAATGRDPLQLRLDSLASDSRAQAVVAALKPAWNARPAGGNGVGAGIAFHQYEVEFAYVATYVEVRVDQATGAIAVTRVVVAHDCGLIINPDGLRNQIEGNVVQGISRTLKEQVAYGPVAGTAHTGVTSVVWDTSSFHPGPQYSVIRFDEVPPIEVILIDRPEEPAWGAGEPTIGTIGGAIGNAVFAATGKRVRQLPMTAEVVASTPVG